MHPLRWEMKTKKDKKNQEVPLDFHCQLEEIALRCGEMVDVEGRRGNKRSIRRIFLDPGGGEGAQGLVAEGLSPTLRVARIAAAFVKIARLWALADGEFVGGAPPGGTGAAGPAAEGVSARLGHPAD